MIVARDRVKTMASRVRSTLGHCAFKEIPYSGKLLREKTFANFVAIRESVLREILGAWHPLAQQKFSPRKFPATRYAGLHASYRRNFTISLVSHKGCGLIVTQKWESPV